MSGADKPRVLFLPGYACRSTIWQAVLPPLEPSATIDLVDWPVELTPGFHSLDAFVAWLAAAHDLGSYDVLVGHSMGGRVALRLAATRSITVGKIILVESFLTSPGPFFQNLFMPDCPERVTAPVTLMLAEESNHYSLPLRESLRRVDLTEDVTRVNAAVYAVYGDRGCGESERVVTELGWSVELQKKIEVEVLAGACHFPMVEQPASLGDLLSRLVR